MSDREIDMAERLVEGMVAAWDPEKYKDTYRHDLMKMIEKRVEAGQLESSPEPAPKPKAARGNVVDLMALLKQSVEQGGKAAPKKAASRRPAKKAPAKKTAQGGQAGRRRREAEERLSHGPGLAENPAPRRPSARTNVCRAPRDAVEPGIDPAAKDVMG